MNWKYIRWGRRPLSLLLAFFLLIALPACSSAPDVDYGDSTPSLSDDELPNPSDTAPPEDTTDYPGRAAAVFEGISIVPAEALTYESTEGGILLTAYHGTEETVILPDTIDGKLVVALGDAMFQGNTTIKALSIPDSVQRIGKDLVSGCRALQVIKTPQLGATRTSDGYLAYLFGGISAELGAFKISSSLDTVILSEETTSIPSLAFYGAYRLVMVILPDTLQEVGSYAFAGCTALKYAALPENVLTLGDGIFADCTSLTTFTVPDSVQHIGCGVLMGCKNLVSLSLPYTGESAQSQENSHFGYIFGAEAYVFNKDYLPSSLHTVTIRHGDLSDYAFYECDRLYRVTLPADCKRIGVRAFHGCSSLLSISLPEALTHIEDMAFSDCTWLSEVTFGDHVVQIGMQAFMGCINLKEVVLPKTLTVLEPSTFAGCKRLRSITLGESLTTVGNAVFRHCISLNEVKAANGSPVSAADLTIGQDNDAFTLCIAP